VKAQPCESLAAATRAAYEDAKAQGGVVLLAPACASFDQFPNFEKRGDAFEAAVREIINI
jgi:UDP-N-acetylmuramoylalanine--D-glutamate ligase